MKYFFDITDKKLFATNRSNAVVKPRLDTIELARRDGYTCMISNGLFYNSGCPRTIKDKICRKLHLLHMSVIRHKLRKIKNIEVKMQYPFLVPEMLGFAEQLKHQGCKLTILIHDWYQIREKRENDHTEERLLQITDKMIVHSYQMDNFMRHHGFKGVTEVLHFFPFLTDYKPTLKPWKPGEKMKIIFAGNLEKSGFINELPEVSEHLGDNVEFLLYGKPEPRVKGTRIKYMGVFDNENLSKIQGNIGLVWDGPSAKTCEGDSGNYLRYNAPYKASLYRALGIPVIVWNESAQAKYVKERNLGLIVNSLYEIR